MGALYKFLCGNITKHGSAPYPVLDVTRISLLKLGVAKLLTMLNTYSEGTCATPAIHDALSMLSKKKIHSLTPFFDIRFPAEGGKLPPDAAVTSWLIWY